jgi:hypothetical protein
MIECIFTVDYEIYGNGQGSLRELVYEPAERLRAVFEQNKARFVLFVEVAELEMIEAEGSDEAIGLVKKQIRDFMNEGYELGLHIHPQWYNAKRVNGEWGLDYREYNLCLLSRDRINKIVDRSIEYLRVVLNNPKFTPVSFRAGNWLFQPSRAVAQALTERGIRVDSSVFKGGRLHQHNVDYRRALNNGAYWPFSDDVNVPDPRGGLIEFPVFAEMVPIWRIFTNKRIKVQRRAPTRHQAAETRGSRLLDFARFHYPRKLDICRLGAQVLKDMVDREIRRDRKDPGAYRPIVPIGHTKDLVDIGTIESFLDYLKNKAIKISGFGDSPGLKEEKTSCL